MTPSPEAELTPWDQIDARSADRKPLEGGLYLSGTGGGCGTYLDLSDLPKEQAALHSALGDASLGTGNPDDAKRVIDALAQSGYIIVFAPDGAR